MTSISIYYYILLLSLYHCIVTVLSSYIIIMISTTIITQFIVIVYVIRTINLYIILITRSTINYIILLLLWLSLLLLLSNYDFVCDYYCCYYQINFIGRYIMVGVYYNYYNTYHYLAIFEIPISMQYVHHMMLNKLTARSAGPLTKSCGCPNRKRLPVQPCSFRAHRTWKIWWKSGGFNQKQ